MCRQRSNHTRVTSSPKRCSTWALGTPKSFQPCARMRRHHSESMWSINQSARMGVGLSNALARIRLPDEMRKPTSTGSCGVCCGGTQARGRTAWSCRNELWPVRWSMAWAPAAAASGQFCKAWRNVLAMSGVARLSWSNSNNHCAPCFRACWMPRFWACPMPVLVGNKCSVAPIFSHSLPRPFCSGAGEPLSTTSIWSTWSFRLTNCRSSAARSGW